MQARNPGASNSCRLIRAALFAVCTVLCASLPARAAIYTWSGTSSALWTNALNWSPATGTPGVADTAVFNGASSNTTIDLSGTSTVAALLFDTSSAAAYTIGSGAVNSQTLRLANSGSVTMTSTVANNQLVNALLMLGTNATAGTYTLTNDSLTNNLTLAGSITGGSGGTGAAKTLTIGGAGATSISGAISNGGASSLALTKSGLGMLTLTNANTYTGTTTINSGTLQIGNGGTVGSISSSSVLTFGGGSLVMNRSDSGTQTFASTTLNAGVLATVAANATNTINFGAITRGVGSAMNIPATGSFITSTGNVNGILSGGITYGGTTWAVANGGTAITGLGTFVLSSTAGTTAGNYTNGNIDVDASVAPGAAITPNSLRFNSAGAYTLTLPAAANTVGSGGILVTSNVGANASTITGGTIAGSSGGDLVIWQNNTSGTFTLSSAIANNSTATGLTKSGAGTLTLTGVNTYTGTTNIAAGGLTVGSGGSINSSGGRVVVGGGASNAWLTINGGNVAGTASGAGITVGSSSSAGVITISSGSLGTNSSMIIGESGYGALLVNGGAVSTLGTGIVVGNNSGRGLLVMTGGTATLGTTGARYDLQLGGATGSSAGSVAAFSGGAFTANAGIYVNRNSILDVSGGLISTGNFGVLGVNSSNLSGTSIVNVRGGSLITQWLTVGAGAAAGTGTNAIVNFNGGELSLIEGSLTSMQGLTQANVFSGGAIISVSVNKTAYVNQNLLAASGTGVSTIAVSGGAGYVAPPIVNISGGGGSGATALATVDANGNLTGITVTNPGTGYTSTPTVTLFGGGGSGASIGAIAMAANTSGGFFRKAGSGALVLGGSNTYSGGTQISNGVLTYGNLAALSTGTVTYIGNATLRAGVSGTLANAISTSSTTAAYTGYFDSGAYNATLSGVISGSGSLFVSGSSSGMLTLSGSNSFSGSTRIGTGGLTIGHANALQNSTLDMNVADSGTISFSQDSTLGGLTGSRSLDMGTRTLSIGNNNANTTYSGTLSNGALTKVGSGTLTLSGSNSFSGLTRISAGRLTISNTNALQNSTLDMNGSDSGTVSFSQDSKLGGLTGSRNLDMGTRTLSIGNNNASTTYSGGLSNGALTKIGTGTQVLTGSNSYTGATTVSAGMLQFGKAASLYGGTTANWTAANIRTGSGATLAFNVGGTGEFTTGNVITLLTNLASSTSATNGMNAGSILGFDTTNASGGTFTINDAIADSIGTSGGARGLRKLGLNTLVLGTANTYTGATSVEGGTLAFGLVSALNSSSGIGINAGSVLDYTGTAATLSRNITVATSGTGTIRNSGGQKLTLSGTLTKDGRVLRLTGGQFDVTGQILGASANSDLLVDGTSTVKLLSANTYNGPTFVNGASTLIVGINNAIPNNSLVTLGDATTRGTLDLGTFTDAIGGLVFSGSGGTVKMAANQTSAVQLSSTSALALDSIASLDLTGMQTSAGLYRLISASSLSGTFADVTGLNSNYVLRYGTVNANEISAQRKAEQTFTMTTGTVTRALVNTNVAVSGSLTNSTPTGGSNLSVSLSFGLGGLTVGSLTSGTTSIAPQGNTSVNGTIQTGATAGLQAWSVINTDNNAITTTSTASSSLTVVNQRTFTSPSTISLGNFLRTASMTGSTSVTSLGTYATTASGSLGDFVPSNTKGFTLSTNDSTAFNGAPSQTANYSLGGSASSAGVINGSFSSTVSAELGSIDPVTVSLVGTAYDAASISQVQNPAVNVVNNGTISISNAAGSYRSAAYVASTTLTGQGWSVTGFGTGTSAAAGATLAGTAHFDGTGLLSGTYTGLFSATFQNQQNLTGAQANDLGSLSWNLYQTYVNTSGSGSTTLGADTALSTVSLTSGTGAGATVASFAAGSIGPSGADVAMSFTSGGLGLYSNVLNLEGTNGLAQVLQLTYDSGLLGGTSEDSLVLAWFDPSKSAWVNSVLGNTGTNPINWSNGFQGSWATYLASTSGSATAANSLGAFGVDKANKTVWAAINHNSQFAVTVIVPEPGSLALAGIGIGIAGWMAFRRRGAASK